MFWSGQSLEELYRSLADKTPTGMGALFVSAMREWKKSFERGASSPIALQMRIEKAMDVALARETERLEFAPAVPGDQSVRRRPSSASSARWSAS